MDYLQRSLEKRPTTTLRPMKHPANDWEWEDNAEMAFVEWFHGDYGSPYSIRSDWFYGDCVEPDEEQRKEILIKWLHSAFLSGYNTGRCTKTNEN
jgi:hypothetical protein